MKRRTALVARARRVASRLVGGLFGVGVGVAAPFIRRRAHAERRRARHHPNRTLATTSLHPLLHRQPCPDPAITQNGAARLGVQ